LCNVIDILILLQVEILTGRFDAKKIGVGLEASPLSGDVTWIQTPLIQHYRKLRFFRVNFSARHFFLGCLIENQAARHSKIPVAAKV
jgi:hypothetical protein